MLGGGEPLRVRPGAALHASMSLEAGWGLRTYEYLYEGGVLHAPSWIGKPPTPQNDSSTCASVAPSIGVWTSGRIGRIDSASGKLPARSRDNHQPSDINGYLAPV